MEPEKKIEIGVEELKRFLEKYELNRLHTDFIEKMLLLVLATVGLIAAISWESVLKEVFGIIFGTLSSLEEKVLYAFLITVGATLLSLVVSKLFLKKERREKIDDVQELMQKLIK
jgi:hypothetical protein